MTSFYSGLSRKEWQRLKLHFRRISSLRLKSKDRAVFRDTLQFICEWLSTENGDFRALPVSTIEWSSSVFKIGDKKIALVDVEQANAINFLLSRTFFSERPIFTYVEFMVRAAEASVTLGDRSVAISLSEICNKKLSDYANANGGPPQLDRPGVFHPHLEALIKKNISLAFVTGHEIGHLCHDDETPTMQWARQLYQKHETEPGKYIPEKKFIRFLKPECVQKFDAHGHPSGDALLQIKFHKKFHLLERHLIEEAHADCIGLVAATHAALDTKITPDDLFWFLFLGLEASEMLMSLKRVIPRLPIEGKPSSVAYEHTSLGFRRFSLITAIRDLRNGKLEAPTEVREYWKTLPRKMLVSLIRLRDSSYVESGSNRTVHISRAALVYALTESLPDAPSENDIVEAWGSFASSGFFLASYTKIPKAWMEIDLHHTWKPNQRDEVLAVGFASALKDIASVIFTKDSGEVGGDNSLKRYANDDDALLSYVRHPRAQVFYRRLIPPPR